MSNQVQCPNCGGYKTDVEKVESIGAYTKGTPGRNCLLILLYIFIITPIFAFLAIVVIALFIMIITIPLGILLWEGMQSVLESILDAVKGDKEHIKKYWLKCEICGYSWVWRTDEPYPSIQIRPEFLVKMEAQRWKCIRCGNENEGSQSSCSYCYAPKM